MRSASLVSVYVGVINRSCKIVGIVERMQALPASGLDAGAFERVVLVPATPPGPIALYLVRTEPGLRDAMMARVEQELDERMPGRFIKQTETFTATAQSSRAPARASAIILSIVAMFVTAVTAVGIFGLVAFNVTRRTQQLGTCRALGARRSQILGDFLAENWLITTAGALVGCLFALAIGVKLSVAYQLPRLPLIYLVGGVVCLWIVGLLAASSPAHRASAIPPAVATRMS